MKNLKEKWSKFVCTSGGVFGAKSCVMIIIADRY